MLKEAINLVEEGVATAEAVDIVVRTTFGYRLAFFGPFAIADMAGLDVYANGFETFEKAFGPRMATPELLRTTVAAGRYGTKNGAGLTRDFTPDEVAAVVAYRSEAYGRMAALLRDLGPSPIV